MSGGNKFQARLESQKAQLERNGYSAEVVVRTTPEATDMINFARLWEHILLTADRRSRGYMSADKRADYEKTQKAFLASVDTMMKHMSEEVERHNIDLTGNNFISRVAQRYNIAEPRKPKEKPPKSPEKSPEKSAEKSKAPDPEKATGKAEKPKTSAQQHENAKAKKPANEVANEPANEPEGKPANSQKDQSTDSEVEGL